MIAKLQLNPKIILNVLPAHILRLTSFAQYERENDLIAIILDPSTTLQAFAKSFDGRSGINTAERFSFTSSKAIPARQYERDNDSISLVMSTSTPLTPSLKLWRTGGINSVEGYERNLFLKLKLISQSISISLMLILMLLFFNCDINARNSSATSINISSNSKKPIVSIITSVYKGDEFIKEFLKDITRQTIFNNCELILINANSPGKEEDEIKKYLKKYKNIKYIKLDYDPGLYAVWNMAIKMAKADFVTNANLDDRRNPCSLKMHSDFLKANKNVDLVYSDYLVTQYPNETFEQHTLWFIARPSQVGVNTLDINKCGFGPQPMWRKSLHEKYGYFDENYKIAGDWEMSIRALLAGANFKKIPGISGLYYNNPTGLSTENSSKRKANQDKEHEIIFSKYLNLWRQKFGTS